MHRSDERLKRWKKIIVSFRNIHPEESF